MLVNELKPAIQSKRRGLLSKRALLLHDNTRPHMAAHTVDILCALKFEVLKHPPFSSDLVPSDFNLFGPMKEHLLGQKFTDDDVVMEAVECFFLEDIRKLVKMWTKCVAKQRDYVEKYVTNIFYKNSFKKLL
jgi:hypothetical protein